MKVVVAVVISLLITFSAFAQDTSKPLTISGYAFGDYYAVAKDHRADLEDRNGFWIRRAYLTFDKTLSDALSARFRLEANQAGDFTTNSPLDPFIKDLHVRWKANPHAEIVVGLSPSPTWEFIEGFWGYRSIERTPVDLQRLASSRDMGVAVLGTLDTAKRLRYHFMVGNGSGTGSEVNEGKLAALAVGYALTKSVVVEVYADHEDRSPDGDRSILQGFGGFQTDRYRAGLQYAHQTRKGSGDIDIASAFGVYNLRKDLVLIGRIDHQFDPNPDGNRIAYLPFDPTSESTLLLAGVDWKVHPNLSIIPNIEFVTYEKSGLEDDIVPRLTFYFRF